MKKISGYLTSDGKIFNNGKEAGEHELQIRWSNEIREWAHAEFGEMTDWEKIVEEMILQLSTPRLFLNLILSYSNISGEISSSIDEDDEENVAEIDETS